MRMVSYKRRVSRPYVLGAVMVLLLVVLVAVGIALSDHLSSEFHAGGEATITAVDAAIGATVEPLDRATAESLGIPSESRGLVITSLGRNGPAERTGIKAGDVIQRIDGVPVGSVRDAADALQEAPDVIGLTLNRRGHYANVKMPTRALPDERGLDEEGAMR